MNAQQSHENSSNHGKSKDCREDSYQRPNLAWTCGKGSEACRCPLGPLGPRKCGSQSEEKCAPKASLRTWRKRFTIAVTTAVAGLVLIGCWQPWRADFLAPGPLSASHAQLFQHETADANRCAACHEAGNASPGDWLLDTFTGGHHIGTPQPTKCMVCHEDTLIPELALAAHNVGEDQLRRVQKSLVSSEANNSRIFRIADHVGDHVACSACHREHHGKDYDLAALTDSQCQNCHQSQFESFANGHPEFGDWSTRVSLGIEFDHASHLNRHFPDKQTAFDCQQCHTADSRGDIQLLAGFETTCAACHEKSIKGNLSGGIQLVALPMIDTQQLNDAGVSIGAWPAQATGDFDGKLPPLMQVLLAGDPRGSQALESLGDDFDFYDVDTADPKQLAATAELIWSIKRLIRDVATKGEAEVRERLELSLRRQSTYQNGAHAADSPADEAIIQLASQVSIDAIADLQASWFPDLDADLRQRPVSVLQTAKTGDSSEDLQLVAFQQPIPESSSDGELLLENPLRSRYRSNLPRVVPAGNGTDIASQQPTHGNIPNHSIQKKQDSEPQRPKVDSNPKPPASPGGKLLQENPLKSLMSGSSQPVANANDTPAYVQPPQILQDRPPATDQAVDSGTQQTVREIVREQLKSQQLYPPANSTAGWMRDDELLTLTWRADQHADPVVRAWLDALVSSGIANDTQSVMSSVASRELDSSSGTGYCLQCHGATDKFSGATDSHKPQKKSSIASVAWKASYRDSDRRSFTRFSHAPHVMQTSLNDCQTCHQLSDAPAAQTANLNFEKQNPFKQVAFHTSIDSAKISVTKQKRSRVDSHHSDFIAIGKQNCMQCHNATAVSQSCTQCHGYHVGSRILK